MTRTPATTRLVPAGAIAIALSLTLLSCSSSSGDGSSSVKATSTTAASSATPGPVAQGTTLTYDQPGLATKVQGPVSGGHYGIPYLALPKGVAAKHDYTEDEYFLTGTAHAYDVENAKAEDGTWTAAPDPDGAAYKTRIVVRRPKDDADFSGTVVVEWLNVTAGRDSDPDFGYLGDELMANGDAYVGVSAQKTGVEPGGLGMTIPGVPKAALAPLKDWDPQRYSSLHHPGDPFSYDMFTQAANTATKTGPGTPLGDLKVKQVIATGESQSASRLVSYVDAVQPVTKAFDGFLIHSRGKGGTAFADGGEAALAPVVHIRDDLDVPVLQFETETDLDFLKFLAARQPDTDHLMTWETAGTSHVDRSALDYGVSAGHRWTDVNVDLSKTCGLVNDGPQQPVVQKAYESLRTWVGGGAAPATSPQLKTDPAIDGVIVRDADGIAEGGIRTPPVDAPTSVLTGQNEAKDVICVLFGSTTPFTPAQLAAHYPDHATYVAAVTTAANKAVADGFLQQSTATTMIADAQAAKVPS